jgi:hypothetical protein
MFTFIIKERFVHLFLAHSDAKSILESWGLSLADGTIDIDARLLPPEDIYFGNDAIVKGNTQAEWTRHISNNSVLSAVITLVKYIIILYTYINYIHNYLSDFPVLG